jgi:DNA-binding LacI/PurR family transcriptional regulator
VKWDKLPFVAESKISDVARTAGVSVSTVLNVLDGRTSRLRAEVIERTKKAIAAVRYRPIKAATKASAPSTSPAARKAAASAKGKGAESDEEGTRRAPLLGLLVPSIANPFFGVLASEIERAAHAHGYRVLFGNTYRDPKKERDLLEDFFANGIRGVITASSLTTQDHYVRLLKRGLTIVSFDRRAAPDSTLPIDYVSVDNVHAGYAATRHLILNGHSAITFVTAPLRTLSRTDRRAGYVSAMQEAGFGKNISVVESSPDTPWDDAELVNVGRRIGKEILAKKNRPTGLVAMSDIIAIGVIAGLQDGGVRVPRDISIVGIDDLYLDALISPTITSIRQPIPEIAESMVGRLVKRIETPNLAPAEQVFRPALVVRNSVRKLSGR